MVRVYHSLLNHLLSETFGLFPVWAIMNESAMDFHVQIFLGTEIFISLG